MRPSGSRAYSWLGRCEFRSEQDFKKIHQTDSLHNPAQINGTTGYEEAGAQGVLAGINAGLASKAAPPLILTRADSFIGVLVDDLITKGVQEPCERHTSLFFVTSWG